MHDHDSDFETENDELFLVCECGHKTSISRYKDEEFIEVYIDTPLEVCETRDPKGFYKKARTGEIPNFTGISSPYEAPKNAEIHVETSTLTIEESAQQIIDYLDKEGYLLC